jgi:hypothetical protein
MRYLRRNAIAVVAIVFAMTGTGVAPSRYLIIGRSLVRVQPGPLPMTSRLICVPELGRQCSRSLSGAVRSGASPSGRTAGDSPRYSGRSGALA